MIDYGFAVHAYLIEVSFFLCEVQYEELVAEIGSFEVGASTRPHYIFALVFLNYKNINKLVIVASDKN